MYKNVGKTIEDLSDIEKQLDQFDEEESHTITNKNIPNEQSHNDADNTNCI